MQMHTCSINLHASVQARSIKLQFRKQGVFIRLKMQGHQMAHGEMLLASNTSQMRSGKNMRKSERRSLIRGTLLCHVMPCFAVLRFAMQMPTNARLVQSHSMTTLD